MRRKDGERGEASIRIFRGIFVVVGMMRMVAQRFFLCDFCGPVFFFLIIGMMRMAAQRLLLIFLFIFL